MTETKRRTFEEIQAEISLEQTKLLQPIPFNEQEEILKRIRELLIERGAANG